MGATSAAYCHARLLWSVWTPPSAFRELLTVARCCALRSPEHCPGMVSPFSTEESRTVSTLQQLELRDGIKGSHLARKHGHPIQDLGKQKGSWPGFSLKLPTRPNKKREDGTGGRLASVLTTWKESP